MRSNPNAIQKLRMTPEELETIISNLDEFITYAYRWGCMDVPWETFDDRSIGKEQKKRWRRIIEVMRGKNNVIYAFSLTSLFLTKENIVI